MNRILDIDLFDNDHVKSAISPDSSDADVGSDAELYKYNSEQQT